MSSLVLIAAADRAAAASRYHPTAPKIGGLDRAQFCSGQVFSISECAYWENIILKFRDPDQGGMGMRPEGDGQ